MKFVLTEQCLAYRYILIEANDEDEAISKWNEGEGSVVDCSPEIDTDNAEIVHVATEKEFCSGNRQRASCPLFFIRRNSSNFTKIKFSPRFT